MYGDFRYVIKDKETPLYLLLHSADMWASRVIEAEGPIPQLTQALLKLSDASPFSFSEKLSFPVSSFGTHVYRTDRG